MQNTAFHLNQELCLVAVAIPLARAVFVLACFVIVLASQNGLRALYHSFAPEVRPKLTLNFLGTEHSGQDGANPKPRSKFKLLDQDKD